jgi:hypothetical protein
VDSAGHIPIVSTILFSNPNSFFTTSSLSPIRIYALPSRSPESLLALTAPRTIRLAGHEEGYSFDVNFTLKDVGSIDGGNATVAAVLEVSKECRKGLRLEVGLGSRLEMHACVGNRGRKAPDPCSCVFRLFFVHRARIVCSTRQVPVKSP